MRSSFTGCAWATTGARCKNAPVDWPRLAGGCSPLCAAPGQPLCRSHMAENGKPAKNVGKVIEIKGVVIDAVFTERLPEIYTALRIDIPASDGEEARGLIAEVQQHLGDDRLRAVAIDSTDGLSRGVDVIDTGQPISVPVGKVTLGRVWNVLGDPVDNKPAAPEGTERWPIHRDPPLFSDLSAATELFETGIKVIDLIAPFIRGGKIGLFGGAGLGKTILIQE